MLCNSYVYENQGGETDVGLVVGDRTLSGKFYADNVTPDGGLVENKAAIAVSSGELPQLSNYLAYLDENGGSLEYNFFRSPVTGMGGPNSVFASALADAATQHNIGVHIYDYDWWNELQ
jgi:hypothetical protein